MKKALLFTLMLLSLSIGAQAAGTVAVTWTETDPLVDTLGNTLVSDGVTITGRSFYCGATPGNESATAVQSGTATTYTAQLTPGQSETCYCTVSASDGTVSPHSVEVTKTAPAAIPAAPGCS